MSFAAVQGNVTMNIYSAFSMSSALFPIIGFFLSIGLLYILFFQRNFLTKLLVGYLCLVFIGVGLYILYGVLASWQVILDFIYGFLFGVGETTVNLFWPFGVFLILSSPLAYWIGNKLLKDAKND